tara:strand:+ start:214 stop:618 length:405 start_codon:yes stop_codon:yes gene_type:complete
MRIGLVGSKFYSNSRKIKDTIFQLSKKFQGSDLTIVSGGNKNGAEKFVKKYALELECEYVEYNAAHTNKNLYSALNEKFYGKPYHVKNFHHQNKLLSQGVDCLIAFIPEGIECKEMINLIKQAKKFGRNVVIIH